MESVLKFDTNTESVQVSDRVRRRRFTADYKLKVVREADGCKQPGELGALLRREGLYSSHLVAWRRARDRGELLSPQKRGRKSRQIDDRDRKISELERQLSKATARAEHAEALVELQKKLATLLGRTLESEKP